MKISKSQRNKVQRIDKFDLEHVDREGKNFSTTHKDIVLHSVVAEVLKNEITVVALKIVRYETVGVFFRKPPLAKQGTSFVTPKYSFLSFFILKNA